MAEPALVPSHLGSNDSPPGDSFWSDPAGRSAGSRISEKAPGAQELRDGPRFHVVLLEPEIPQNTGAIGRLCLGTGCRLHLIKPLGFQIDEKAVRRAGLDYWKHVDLCVHETFEDLLRAFPRDRLTFTSARAGESFVKHAFVRGEVLIFGRESVGLPAELKERFAEQFIRIPNLNTVRSLNLSQAVAVVVYEGLKQIEPQSFL